MVASIGGEFDVTRKGDLSAGEAWGGGGDIIPFSSPIGDEWLEELSKLRLVIVNECIWQVYITEYKSLLAILHFSYVLNVYGYGTCMAFVFDQALYNLGV